MSVNLFCVGKTTDLNLQSQDHTSLFLVPV